MFQIAICNNKKTICSQIENIILDYQRKISEKIDVDIFYSGKLLYHYISEGADYDLLFLDIELCPINGIEIGKKIRNELKNYTLQIIYISRKNLTYSKALFDVRPMHLLYKPLDVKEVIQDIDIALILSRKYVHTFTFKKGHDLYIEQIKNILYFEAKNRQVKMVTTSGEIQFYGSINRIFEKLESSRFIRTHNAYVVNYNHIIQFGCKEIKMSNNELLPISQRHRKLVKYVKINYGK